MVTISEAQQILSQRRSQIQGISLPALTQAELRRQTQQSIISRQQQSQNLQALKQQELQKLKPVEEEIRKAEAQVQKQRSFQSQVRDTFQRLLRGKPPAAGASSGARAEVTRIVEANPSLKRRLSSGETPKESTAALGKIARATGFREIETLGFTPIIKAGQIVGIKDFITNRTIPLENINEVGLKRLEKSGLIKLVEREKLFTPIAKDFKIPEIPRGLGALERFIPTPGEGFGIPKKARETGQGPVQFFVTSPLFKFLESKGFSKERIAGIITSNVAAGGIQGTISLAPLEIQAEFKKFRRDLDGVSKEFIIGTLEGIEQEPEKIIALSILSSALPLITTAGGSLPIVNKVLNKIPANIKSKGAKAVTASLGALYATSVGIELAQSSSIEEAARRAGFLTSTEVVPFVIGTGFGVKGELRKTLKKDIEIELNKLSGSRRAAFEDYMRQAEILGKYEPRVKNIKLNNVEGLPTKEAEIAMRKYLRLNKNEITVGGSVAQTGQVDVKRKLGDLDLYLETKDPRQAARELADFLRKNRVKDVAISPRNPTTVTIQGKKVGDFQNIERLLVNIRQVIPNWQDPRRYIMKTPEGIRIQRIGLQARRKLVAAFADPKRMATGKFRKDLKDFKAIAETLFRRAELRARGNFFFRESRIKRLEKQFGRKISRKPLPGVKKLKILEKSPIAKRLEKIRKLKPFEKLKPPKRPPRAFKSLKGTRKSKFKKLSERKPAILRRSELRGSQRPFSKVGRRIRVVPRLSQSQPSILKRRAKILGAPKLIPPSQPPARRPGEPFKPVPIRIPLIISPPSQPPITPPRVPKTPPFGPPPRRPPGGRKGVPPTTPRLLKPIPGRKKIKKKPLVPAGKRFDVFTRQNKKDIFRKSFGTRALARKNLKKRLTTKLRASGFIVDKQTGKRLKPKVSPGFRVSKVDKFRLVEKRNRRITRGTAEVPDIQAARRRKRKR